MLLKVADAELDVMISMTKVFNKNLETPENCSNCDDWFGKMITGELRSFPKHIKCCVKHDINNTMFNYKMVIMEVKQKIGK